MVMMRSIQFAIVLLALAFFDCSALRSKSDPKAAPAKEETAPAKKEETALAKKEEKVAAKG